MTTATPDIVIDNTLSSASSLFHRREFKASSGPAFDFKLDATVANGQEQVNTSDTDISVTFAQNLRYWNEQTQYLATNDFNNSYFRSIVGMGIEAVPFILEEISRHPSFLVHALDEILPGIVEYGDGYIPVEKACETWISILKPTKIV